MRDWHAVKHVGLAVGPTALVRVKCVTSYLNAWGVQKCDA